SFVDDLRYAGAFAREKARLQGWGPVKIRFALRSKGIASELIEEALETVDTQAASDKLSKLLQAKAASLEGDPQKKFKLIKFALSRGYEYDQIRDYISLY
ncbi:MAG: RecX family transcriptional regulator, partial [Bacteroidales bacterium]|nr:RecX family transcriptional regulator [Bacteroidales bacterium]